MLVTREIKSKDSRSLTENTIHLIGAMTRQGYNPNSIQSINDKNGVYTVKLTFKKELVEN